MIATEALQETQKARRGHNFYPPQELRRKIPALYETDGVELAEKVIYLHYFSSSSDWYIAELNQATGEAFGFACLNGDRQNAEWGYIPLPELESIPRAPMIPVERDCHFAPRTFSRAVPWAQPGYDPLTPPAPAPLPKMEPQSPRTDLKVVEILPDDSGGGIRKTMRGYAYRLRYRLEDGQVICFTVSNRLLRDAKKEIATLPKSPAHEMTANFRDGKLSTVTTRFNLFR